MTDYRIAAVLLAACAGPTEPLPPMCDTFDPAFIDEVVGRPDWPDGTWLVFSLTIEVDGVPVPRGTMDLPGALHGTEWLLDPLVPCTPEPGREPGRLFPMKERSPNLS